MWRRLLALILKELQIILGNKHARMLLITPVILQTVIFPFAATMEVRQATIVICNQDSGPASVELVQRLARTAAFSEVKMVRSERELRAAIDGQTALVALTIPSDFSRRLLGRQSAPVQLIMDGRHSNSGQIASGYAAQVIQGYSNERAGRPESLQIVRDVYNPNLESKWHVLPCLVAICTTIGCLIVTALSVAREREEGTFDQLLVSPLTPGYIMAGKAVPGVLIAVAQGSFIALTASWCYGVPFRGSAPVLLLGMVCFGLALAGIGLCISSLSMTQQQGFFGVFSFMSPAVLLSGYVSPVENMPRVFQWLAQADPLTHFILILKGLFLKGFGIVDAWPHLWPLLVIALCTLSVALGMFRRHIA